VNRRNVILAAAGLLVAGLIAGLIVRAASGAPSNRLLVAGDVRVNSRTVVAPPISTPVPDYAVGIPTTAAPTGGPSGSAKTPPQPQRTGQPVVSGLLTHVYVRTGDTVKAGQPIAQIDTKLLDLGVKQAKANAARQKANVAVLGKTLDTLANAQDKLATARSTAFSTAFSLIDAAIAKAVAPVYQQHAAAVAARPKLVAAIAGIEAALAHLPPNAPQVPALKAKLAQLKAQLAGIDAFLKQWPSIKKKLQTQTATAAAAAKAKAGAAINTKIDQAQTKITDAKTRVKNARAVLKIIADSSHVGVDLAEAKRAQATILAPVGGLVTYAVPAGTVAMVGSPIIRVQPDEPALVDTYLTGDQLRRVHLGSAADITYDSAPGKVLHGKVAIIGDTAQYPPTSFPTDIVHMTRTVKVTIRLDSGDSPPQGTPVDIAIHTN